MIDKLKSIKKKEKHFLLAKCLSLFLIFSIVILSACSISSIPPSTPSKVILAPTSSYVDNWKAQILDYGFTSSDSDIRFERISLVNGLSDPIITCMLQDKIGYLWIGTQNGLNRYNGYSFTVYEPQPDEPTSLSDHWITALTNGNNGTIWVGTENGGVNQFIPETGKFIRFQNNSSDPNSLINDSINALVTDEEGFLWIATDNGLTRLDPSKGQFTNFQNDPNDPTSLSDNHIISLFEDQERVLWIGTAEKGIDRLDLKTNRFIHFSFEQEKTNGLLNTSINVITKDDKGYLWIGTSSGLLRFNFQTEKFIAFKHTSEDQESLENDNIHAIIVDRIGDVWVGSEHGLERYNWQSSKFTEFHSQPGNTYSISNNFILSVFEDNEGILWIGTYGSGLNKYNRDQNRFSVFRNDQNNPASISSNLIYPILIDSAGDLWVGTYDRGLNKLERSTGKFVHFLHDPKNPNSLASDTVTALYQDKKGTLWIGTIAGLDKFDENKKFTHYVHRAKDETSISNNSIRTIFEDSHRILWVGTDKGFNQFFSDIEEFVNYLNVPEETDSLSHNKVTAILEDTRGEIWIGTLYGGLNRMNRETEIFVRYQFDPLSPQSISNNSITAIFQDKQDTIWVGTSGGGLNKFDPLTNSFIHLTSEDGLPSNNIAGIAEDNTGNLWISTDAGICRFNPTTALFRNYSISEGLPSNAFNIQSVASDPAGRLYFGGFQGLISFHPERVKDSSFLPPVVLTSLTTDGKEVKPGEMTDQINEITLQWPQNSFEFEFAALDFAEPLKNQYAYSLENFDKSWNFIGAKRNGRYTNLSGGNYLLKLMASNNDGVWNEQGTTIKIKVIPPVWETGWFRICAFLTLIIIAFFIYRLRIKNIEKHNRELEGEIKQRTRQINERNQEIEALYHADEKMYRYLNINQALQALVDVAVEMLKADKSCVLVRDEKSNSWMIKAHQGFNPNSLRTLKFSQDDDFIQKVFSSGKPLAMNDPKIIEKWGKGQSNIKDILFREKIHSIILIPLKAGVDTFGIFLIASKASKAFNKGFQRLFTSLSQRASLSIENALLFEQTKELAVMEERTRLARDLHDSAKQKAFAALAQIGAVRGATKKNPISAQEHLKEAENLVYEVIQELTFLIQEMYPMTLKEEGLLVALREYIFEWESRNNIQVDLKVKNELRLGLNIEQTLYRIIQEALANIARHSHAKHVQIGIHYLADRVEATVSDDGKGFEKNQISKGLGLRSMEERAANLGGKVEIESSINNGTIVKINLPFQ